MSSIGYDWNEQLFGSGSQNGDLSVGTAEPAAPLNSSESDPFPEEEEFRSSTGRLGELEKLDSSIEPRDGEMDDVDELGPALLTFSPVEISRWLINPDRSISNDSFSFTDLIESESDSNPSSFDLVAKGDVSFKPRSEHSIVYLLEN